MKKIIAVLLAAIVSFSTFAGCGSSNETANKDTLILGCDINFAPMAYKEDGDIVGFDIDLAKAVFEKMGKKLEVQAIDWNSKEAELDTGKIDIVWNGLTITEKRQEQMNITQPYMENKQVVVVPQGSDIKTIADLEGKRVAMQKESSAIDAYEASGISATDTILKDNVLCLDELASGRQDAVIMDLVVADYYLSKNSERYPFVILEETMADELYGIGVKKGNDELLNQIEDALKECIEDGTAAKISEEWFGADKILPLS